MVRARMLEVLEAAPDRVAAPCPVYGRCGGCHYQHAPYEYQLAAKRAILVEALQRLGKMEPPAEIAVVAAEPFGYRNRVQLHVEEKRLGYREATLAQAVRGDRVPGGVAEDQSGDRGAGGDAARRAVAAIHTVARSVHGRARGADQRAGDGSSGGAALLRLVRDADSGTGGRRAGLPGRVPREQQFVLPGEPVPDRPAGGSGDRKERRARRRSICMRAWDCSRMPLARRFREVTAVESGAGAVRDLQFNAARAGLENLHAIPQTAEEHLAQLEKAPDFVVLDPPRTGLGKAVVATVDGTASAADHDCGVRSGDAGARSGGTGGGGLSRGADDAGGLIPADLPSGDGGAAEAGVGRAVRGLSDSDAVGQLICHSVDASPRCETRIHFDIADDLLELLRRAHPMLRKEFIAARTAGRLRHQMHCMVVRENTGSTADRNTGFRR